MDDFDAIFNNNLTSNPLDEMGNSVAEDSPFGTESTFALCGDFTLEAYTGYIKGFELLFFLKAKTREPFIWENYLTDEAKEEIYNLHVEKRDAFALAPPVLAVIQPTTFNYATMNKRACHINYRPAFVIAEDLANFQFDLRLYYYYEDANDLITRSTTISENPDNTVTVSILDQYKAIILETGSIQTFHYFTQEVGMDYMEPILTHRLQEFQTQLNRNSTKHVEWFYSAIPDHFVQQLDKELIWKDLRSVLSYQESLYFADSSDILIKMVKGIVAQEGGEVYLYDKFYTEGDGKFVKSIYDELGGEEEYEGEYMERQSILASILLALTYTAYSVKNLEFDTVSDFTFDNTHQVDSNVVFSDKYENKFNLTQEEYGPFCTYHRTGGSYDCWETKKGRTVEYLHPLALVNVTLLFGESEYITIPFPAIMVKDMARKQEWEDIDVILRVGFNVLAIAGGIAALLTSGNPLVLMLAVADIGLATTDLIVKAFEDEIMQTETGQKFLQAWEKIYAIGGIVVAIISAPQLIRSVISTGAKLILKAVGATKKFLSSVLVSIVLEINIARAGQIFKTIDVGLDALAGIKKVNINVVQATRLQEEGVIFVRMVDEAGTETYSAVYKGETLVAPGSSKQLKSKLNSAWNKTGDDLVKELDIVALRRKQGKRFNRNQKKAIASHREFTKSLSRTQLDKIKAGLKKLGIDFELHPNYSSKTIKGYFKRNGKPVKMPKGAAAIFIVELEQAKMVLRKGATPYEFFHEYMHFRHSEDIGRVDYLALGGRNTPGEVIKETLVFNKIVENRQFFNQAELEHALGYINKVRKKWGKDPLKFDFDISQIPTKRTNINIEELFSKK